jgi:WD40 repeat-containing protein SMU1
MKGRNDGIIEIRNIENGDIYKDLKYQLNNEFMSHNSSIFSLALSNDFDILASGSKDGVIKCWDIESGKPIFVFEKAHQSGVFSLAISSERQVY